MKLLIDMNLSPEWVQVLGDKGFQTLHWSKIEKGALISIDEGKSRVHILPLSE